MGSGEVAIVALSTMISLKVPFSDGLGGGKMFFIYCSHIMILRLLVIITYRLSIMMPPCTHFVLYFMSPIICFGICVALYDILQKISPSFLGILVGNRIK